MNRTLDLLVRTRARERCEYCLLPGEVIAYPFQIDHIIARRHSGKTVAENLALSCFTCNVNKGPCIAGLDPRSGKLTRLFNPRTDLWRRHFRLRANGVIDGRTAIGRTTVLMLGMNGLRAITLRANLIAEDDEMVDLLA